MIEGNKATVLKVKAQLFHSKRLEELSFLIKEALAMLAGDESWSWFKRKAARITGLLEDFQRYKENA